MKRAKKRFKPRNPVALDPLLRKGGAHQQHGKKASRARQKAALRRDTQTEPQ